MGHHISGDNAMTINIGAPELNLLRARLASLESHLKEEMSAHARTRELLDERATLGEEADLLRLVLENMPVMMNAFDEDGVCVAWNVECERITGYSASEMIGNPDVPDIVLPDPVYRARMMELWPSKQNTRSWEVELSSKDGRRLTIAWSNISEICPIPGWAMWAVGVDVTDRIRAFEKLREVRHELEEQVRQLNAELETANERLRQLLAEQDGIGAAQKERKAKP